MSTSTAVGSSRRVTERRAHGTEVLLTTLTSLNLNRR